MSITESTHSGIPYKMYKDEQEKFVPATALVGGDAGELIKSTNPMPVSPPPYALDAFARQRVTTPLPLFDYKWDYDRADGMWDFLVTGGGTRTHLPDEAALSLAVSTTGDSVENTTHAYWPYEPGKSQLYKFTGILNPVGNGNVTTEIGAFDDNDGLLFRCTNGAVSCVIRSSTSGVPSETVFPQAAWSDPMDGTGASGITVDWSQTQIFGIDYQWLGVGNVRFFLSFNGIPAVVFAKDHANSTTAVYMKSGTLPATYKITSNGGAGTLKQICCSVESEGGSSALRPRTHQQSVSNDFLPVSAAIGVYTPIISIRAKNLYPLLTGQFNRGWAIPIDVGVMALNKQIHWGVYLNAPLTGAVWTDPDTQGLIEYDVSATAINTVQGHSVSEGYTDKKQDIMEDIFKNLAPLTVNRFTGVGDTLTFVAGGLTQITDVLGAFTVREIA